MILCFINRFTMMARDIDGKTHSFNNFSAVFNQYRVDSQLQLSQLDLPSSQPRSMFHKGRHMPLMIRHKLCCCCWPSRLPQPTYRTKCSFSLSLVAWTPDSSWETIDHAPDQGNMRRASCVGNVNLSQPLRVSSVASNALIQFRIRLFPKGDLL